MLVSVRFVRLGADTKVILFAVAYFEEYSQSSLKYSNVFVGSTQELKGTV